MENHILEWVALYLKMLMCFHWQKGDLEPQHPHLPCRGNESEEEWIEACRSMFYFNNPPYTGSIIIPWFALLNIPSAHELIWQWYWQISVRDYWQHHSWWVHDWHTVNDVHSSLHICTVWARLNTQGHRLCLQLEQRETLGSKHGPFSEKGESCWPWNYQE